MKKEVKKLTEIEYYELMKVLKIGELMEMTNLSIPEEMEALYQAAIKYKIVKREK